MVMAAAGHLGAFTVEVAGLAAAVVSSREYLRFGPAQERGRLETDLIVDLGGGQPLFPAPAKRDGYLRCDPRDPVAVQRALYEATGLVGEFEKPHYVAYDAAICAHSRSRRTGCTRCLDQCPTGAIVPAGDLVRIDPFVCAGCGACAGVCPTGAATYAAPSAEHPAESPADPARHLPEGRRCRSGAAGARGPARRRVDRRHGARSAGACPPGYCRSPSPRSPSSGSSICAAAIAYGAGSVLILAPPGKRDEIAGLETTLGYATAMLEGLGYGADRLTLVSEDDPRAGGNGALRLARAIPP